MFSIGFFSNLDNIRARLESKLKSCEWNRSVTNQAANRPHICTQWSHFLQENSLNGFISFPSQVWCVIHKVHFSTNISHNSFNAHHLYGFTLSMSVCALLVAFFVFFLFRDKFPFSIGRQFFFDWSLSISLFVPIQCFVFDWNYIYIFGV